MCAEKKCGLGWKPVGMRAGLSGYSPSCSLNCGSGMQRDPHQTGAQTENRSPGCRAATATPDRRPLSTNLVADEENRDLRQLLWHRHRLVQMRTRIMNQLHVLALNEGVRRKKALWRPAGRAQLQSLVLARWASRRRQDLLELLDQLTPKIQELTRALEQEVEKRPVARRLMTHPGVGPLTALAFELVIGTPERFGCGKQIASYVGLVPSEESSGDRRRLGHISKQGNSLLRFLLVEAAQVTVRTDPDWRRRFLHLALRRQGRIAKVAMARKLAVRLYWMWRKEWNYEQMRKFGSHVEEPVHRQGAS